MNNSENTTFGTAQEQQKKNEKQQTSMKGWQQVSIGGVTGILMGAAGMYAADAFGSEQPEQEETNTPTTGGTVSEATSHTAANGLRIAEVDQNLSFGEAFAAARNEVGTGGVFHWHGNIYNTYTETEWNAMTPSDHAQFAQQVQPEIRPGEGKTEHDVAQHQPQKEDRDGKPEEGKTEAGKPDGGKKEDDDEPEVHFLGVERVDTENGTWNIGHMVTGDQEVALVDMDDDMVFDVAVSDRNQNDNIEENEVVDISEQGLTVTDFALASTMQNESSIQPEMASTSQQDNIAEDMPDYMNDADVQTI